MLFPLFAHTMAVQASRGHAPVISFDAFLEHYDGLHTATALLKTMEERRATFEANIQKITEHNAKGLSWTMGVNHFADLTEDEWADEVGTTACVHTMKSSLRRHQESTQGRLVPVANPQNAASIDWRKSGAVTPVKDQGSCGSCWAFSTTGSTEGAWFNTHKDLVSLSEQQLVDCDGVDSGCNGGLMDYAFEYIEKHGITSETNYPYTAEEGNCQTSKVEDVVATVSSYKDVTSQSQAALENALNVGPVSIAIEADRRAFQLYDGGVLSGDAGCGTQLDHGVLAVGYGTDGKDYWIVKNSWGGQWGESGYIRLERGSSTGSKGTCGLLSQPSYPVVGDSPAPGPTPGPGPTPAPGPTGGDYSDPGTDETACSKGDLAFINEYNVSGRMCLPPCDMTDYSCPAGPSGFSNPPTCSIAPPSVKNAYLKAFRKDVGIDIYCAYDCKSDADCGSGTNCVNYWDFFSVCMFV